MDLSAAREAGRINFARAKEHLAKYLISPMVLRATVQIRHQGVLPHFPDQGHRHPLTIVETRTARLPSIHHADIARPSKFRHRMTSDIPDGGILGYLAIFSRLVIAITTLLPATVIVRFAVSKLSLSSSHRTSRDNRPLYRRRLFSKSRVCYMYPSNRIIEIWQWEIMVRAEQKSPSHPRLDPLSLLSDADD